MFTRLWGKIVAFFVGGICGTVLGVALGFFLFPYVFPPPPATEQLTPADLAPPVASSPSVAAVPVSTGRFIHADTSDPVHWGQGKVSVYQRAVFLEPDFKVGPGPAYHVYLVPKPSIRSTSEMQNVMYVDLGRLRAFEGSQRYQIPDGVNLKDYPSVIIWCQRFSVLISPADLTAAQVSN